MEPKLFPGLADARDDFHVLGKAMKHQEVVRLFTTYFEKFATPKREFQSFKGVTQRSTRVSYYFVINVECCVEEADERLSSLVQYCEEVA